MAINSITYKWKNHFFKIKGCRDGVNYEKGYIPTRKMLQLNKNHTFVTPVAQDRGALPVSQTTVTDRDQSHST